MLFNFLKSVRLTKDKDYWFLKGESLIKSHNQGMEDYIAKYKEAIRCYTKALSLDPDFVDCWNAKGCVFYFLTKYEEAIKCFNKAINIDINNLDGWSNKGLTMYKLKNYREAIKCYDRVIEIDPAYPNAAHNREKIFKIMEEEG